MVTRETTERRIKKLLKAVFTAVQEVKGGEVLVLDMRRAASYTDYLLLVSGTNERQIAAMADRVVEAAFKSGGVSPLGIEGLESLQWVLIDFGDVVCHLFLQNVRHLYHIEDMWPQIVPMNEKEAAIFLATKIVKQKAKSKKEGMKRSRRGPVVSRQDYLKREH